MIAESTGNEPRRHLVIYPHAFAPPPGEERLS